ncbi:MAG: patatin-like phospholipase family protein [Bacteroidota bacterium]
MDAVLDLAARAVSVIVLIQDTLVEIAKENGAESPLYAGDSLFPKFKDNGATIMQTESFIEGGIQINYISLDDPIEARRKAKSQPETPINTERIQYSYDSCLEVIKWIDDNQETIGKIKPGKEDHFPSPEKWREFLRSALFLKPDKRIDLVKALNYMPLQVVLAAGGATHGAKTQRLLQIWSSEDFKGAYCLQLLLNNEDIYKYEKLTRLSEGDRTVQEALLADDEILRSKLEEKNIPLSFLYIFGNELKEITKARTERQKEVIARQEKPTGMAAEENLAQEKSEFESIFAKAFVSGNADNGGKNSPVRTYSSPTGNPVSNDPVQKARDMELWGLAFSGGGIRSATFGLGVLQGLAQKGLIGKFDYLSTVSGGGYLGSWFVSWVSRAKSLLKVSDRLCPKKSPDPFAEEVAPIRWLRMYSNYLTPSTGIMSTDSWTVGMTILRNMLINQLLIMLFLMAVITGVRTLFLIWKIDANLLININNSVPFWLMNVVFLVIATFLAGLGMLSYHVKKEEGTNHLLKKIEPNTKHYSPTDKLTVTFWLVVLGCLNALFLSSWMYRNAMPVFTSNPEDFTTAFSKLQSLFYFGFASLIGVYFLGRYYNCLPEKRRIGHIFLNLFGTVIAAFVGILAAMFVLDIAYTLKQWVVIPGDNRNANAYLAFTLLPPLIIEVMTITVVVRMALLGRNFPDERREWWGRIGGRVHRVSILWIIVMGLIFLGSTVFASLIDQYAVIKKIFVAGWGASLIAGLRIAFISSDSGDKKPKSGAGSLLEFFPLLAPYLFGIAILAYLPELVIVLETKIPAITGLNPNVWRTEIGLGLSLVLALLAWGFGRQIGVNQFSLHLFYKNRLVRSFLGATRQRHERQKSANPFTGFDGKDDIKFQELISEKEYFGPFPIINTTVNVSNVSVLDRQDRKAESFTFTPQYCGFDFSPTRSAANVLVKSYDYAYRPTGEYAYPDGPSLGTAMTISGAAANPNQGYHSNTATAFLLTLFNIRLGWWMGNPRQDKWKNADPKNGLAYVLSDLIGKSDTSKDYVCLSDGGHFDNMGIYELVRRKCRYIVLCDGEQDEEFSCEGLANAIRRCRIDFGVDIKMHNVEKITKRNPLGYSEQQFAWGEILYPEDAGNSGVLIYIKSSMTGEEPVDVREYAKKNMAFPHQSTGDQFFDEAQFESYRQLGLHITGELFKRKLQTVQTEAGSGL